MSEVICRETDCCDGESGPDSRCRIIQISTTEITSGEVGEAYSFTLSFFGGTSPLTWTIIDGSLPDGLSLNSSTGEITGTPTEGGTFTFRAKVEDTNGNSCESDNLVIEITATCDEVTAIRFSGWQTILIPPTLPIIHVRWTNVAGVVNSQMFRSIDGGANFVMLSDYANFLAGFYRDYYENTGGVGTAAPLDTVLQYKIRPLNCGALFSEIITVPELPTFIYLSGFPGLTLGMEILGIGGELYWSGLLGNVNVPEVGGDHDIYGIVTRADLGYGLNKWQLTLLLDAIFGYKLYDGTMNMVFDVDGPIEDCVGTYAQVYSGGITQFDGPKTLAR